MDITITTAANDTYTVTLDSDTGRPVSVIFTGDSSGDDQALFAALGAAFPGYAYDIAPDGWDATGDAGDEPEAIAHLRETELSPTPASLAHAMALADLMAAPSPAALAARVVDADDCDSCLDCEWSLAGICETFAVDEALAERAIARYSRALRDAAAVWAA